jgi:hypothetical protein
MVSASQVKRLTGHLNSLKDEYDSLKIKQLSEHGTIQDAAYAVSLSYSICRGRLR